MKSTGLLQTLRAHLTVALLVGLILGTLIGLFEGAAVLLSQELWGRYNELVAWAIAFDASAVVAVELGLAILNATTFTVMQFESVPFQLVALQLGESVFAATLAFGLWSNGTANPHLLATSPISVIGQPALVGIVLGGLILVATKFVVDQVQFLRRLRARYWLIAEGVVVIGAVAFSFTH